MASATGEECTRGSQRTVQLFGKATGADVGGIQENPKPRLILQGTG
jgi:hypothetical protein